MKRLTILLLLIIVSSKGRKPKDRYSPRSRVGAKRPNILYITTDQQRIDTLACYGSSFAKSPNIDRLARGGVRFTQAYTASPVCSPSRTSVLLGVHVPVHGVYENGVKPHLPGLTPYTDFLQQSGYYTAIIGKTHFSPVPKSLDFLDIEVKKRKPDTTIFDFLETYDVNTSISLLERISSNDAKPWFLHLSMLSPHPPNYVPKGWEKVYKENEFGDINFEDGEFSRLPTQTKMLLNIKNQLDPDAFPNNKPNMKYINQQRWDYYEQSAYVDHEVGRMLDFLDDHKLDSDTLVIFTTDHGSQMFDHGIGNDKHTFFEGASHIPLIMRYPNVFPSGETREFASTLDLTATFLAAAGVPKKSYKQMSGFDLFTPLSSGQVSPRKVGIISEYTSFCVVTKKWKLAYFPEQHEGRLFDRTKDPKEQTNLYGNSKYAEVQRLLVEALLRWRSQQNPLEFLQANSSPGANTATQAFKHTKTLTGLQVEIDLQNDALMADAIIVGSETTRNSHIQSMENFVFKNLFFKGRRKL